MTSLKELINSIPELKGLDYKAIAEWFNAAPMVKNSAEIDRCPKPVTISELMVFVGQARAAEIMELQKYKFAVDAYLSGNTTDALIYLDAIKAEGHITEEEWGNIVGRLEETIPDPNYQEFILGDPNYLTYGMLKPITALDVQEAFN